MKIFADENIGAEVVRQLRDDGHSVSWVIEGARGSKDPEVLSDALESNSLLITNDKDFGELVFSHHLHSAGVLLLRILNLPYNVRASKICALIRTEGDSLLGQFSVLTPSGLRSRGL
jgi:predicted nuclease of predicted toxin-antitoxin system